MIRKKFNAELAIQMRKQLGLTQTDFAEKISDETAALENAPKISLRTIREMESGQAIDEKKGLFVFKWLGQEPSEEIYMEDDAPDFLPLTSMDEQTSYVLSEVSLRHGKEVMSVMEKVDHATHFYLHVGDLNTEQRELVVELADMIERRCKLKPDQKISSRERLGLKLKDSDTIRKAEDIGALVFAEVLEDKFTLFSADEQKWETFQKLQEGSSLRQHLEVSVDNPQFIAAIAITSAEDKAIRFAPDHKGHSLKLLMDKNFTMDDVFPFSVLGSQFLEREQEHFCEMLIPEEKFAIRFPHELPEYEGPFSPLDEADSQILINKKVMDREGGKFIHRTLGEKDQVFTNEDQVRRDKIDAGLNEISKLFYEYPTVEDREKEECIQKLMEIRASMGIEGPFLGFFERVDSEEESE